MSPYRPSLCNSRFVIATSDAHWRLRSVGISACYHTTPLFTLLNPAFNTHPPDVAQSFDPLTLYWVWADPGSVGVTTMNACRKCDAIMLGANGVADSWNTTATMSFPMCRFRCSCEHEPEVGQSGRGFTKKSVHSSCVKNDLSP